MVISALMLAACASEDRIVSTSGPLRSLPGAQTAENAPAHKRPTPSGLAQAQTQKEDLALKPGSLRVEDQDGNIRLISRSPRHVVIHLRQAVLEDDYELFFDQLLSNLAKAEYRRAGRDPYESIDQLRENREDVLKLLQRMPMGEFTPGMYLRPRGRGVYRLEVEDHRLKLRKLDTIWESGVCKFVIVK